MCPTKRSIPSYLLKPPLDYHPDSLNLDLSPVSRLALHKDTGTWSQSI